MPDLRQNTIVTIKYGGFIDSSDFETTQNLLGPNDTDTLTEDKIRLSKNGTAAVDSGATLIEPDGNGKYLITFPITAVDTRGYIDLDTKLSGSLLVEDRYEVLSQQVYDQKYGDKVFLTQESFDVFTTLFGISKIKSIDGSAIDFISMFIKILDNGNGDEFVSSSDSLKAIRSVVGAGEIRAKTADSEVLTTGTPISGSLTDTELPNETLYIVTPLGGASGELDQKVDYITGANRIAIKLEIFGWFGGGGSGNEYVSVWAWSWEDLIYKPVSNNANHMYKRADVDSSFPYTWTIEKEFTDPDTGTVRINYRSSTNNSSRTFNIDYYSIDHLGFHETTPVDFANAVWNYKRIVGNLALDTMGGYQSTLVQGQYLMDTATDAKTFKIKGTFIANSFNKYPVIVVNYLDGKTYAGTISTIDATGNIVLVSDLPFVPTVDDALEIKYPMYLSKDTDVSKEVTLNQLSSDLAITVNLDTGGANLQGNLVDIFEKAGGGGGSGDCLKLTDIINGRPLSQLFQELSVRAIGRIFRVDNGDGSYTLQFYDFQNNILYERLVTENERLLLVQP